jgi:hypothetical protein
VIQRKGVIVTFYFFFVEAKLGKSGLTVTADVYEIPSGGSASLIVTGGSAVEVGGGLYKYALASGSVDANGEYVAIGKTSTTTVDAQHVPAAWVTPVWTDNVDAAVSSRATPAQVNTEADTALADVGLTATVTGRVDAAISSRATPAQVNTEADTALVDAGITPTVTARLDVAVSSRPSAAAIADQVWDESLAGHVVVGSAGAGLTAAGGAGDPWATPLPGTYAAGTAGATLASIEDRTGLISAGGITVASPFDPTTNKLTLVRGDDYPADLPGGIPPFESGDWPNLTGATEIRFTVRKIPTRAEGLEADIVLLTLTDTVAERVEGVGLQSVTFEPLARPGTPVVNGQEGGTLDLIPGRSAAKWDVQATLADGTIRTLAAGLMDVVEDQTRDEA